MIATSEKFTTALAKTPQLYTRALLIDGSTFVELPIASGSVTLDGQAQTRASLALDLALTDTSLVPDSPTDSLAPYGNEIVVERGVIYEDGTTETVNLGIFRTDEVSIDDTGEEVKVSISALDRSAIIIEAVFERAGEIASGTNVADAIEGRIAEAYPDYDFDPVTTTVTLPALHYEAGEDRWDFCRGMAEAAQCTLYFDGSGTLVMRPLPQGFVPVYSITEGEGGTLLGASKRWGREDACNRVVVTGENASQDPVYGEATDDDPSSPTLYGGDFGRVTFSYSSSYVTSDAQAQSVARNILNQRLGTSQQISFDALVNPALEPFDTIGVRRAQIGIGTDDIEEFHILDSLSIPLTHDGTMTGETRVARVV